MLRISVSTSSSSYKFSTDQTSTIVRITALVCIVIIITEL